jgi:hypothetical protein
MQSFDGQILNLPTICGIRIIININSLAENGRVPGDGRVRPVAARAALGLKACAPSGSDPDRERREIAPRFQDTVGLRGRVRAPPPSNLRADPRTAHQAGLSLQRGS